MTLKKKQIELFGFLFSFIVVLSLIVTKTFFFVNPKLFSTQFVTVLKNRCLKKKN